MAPRDTENNAYAKFWGDKQRALWFVMVFLEWSIARGWEKRAIRTIISYSKRTVRIFRVSPQSCSPFSAFV